MFQALRRTAFCQRSNLAKVNMAQVRTYIVDKRGKPYKVSYKSGVTEPEDLANFKLPDGTIHPIEPCEYPDIDYNKVETIDELVAERPVSEHNEALRQQALHVVPPPTPHRTPATEWLEEMLNYVWAPPKAPYQTIASRPRMRMIDSDGLAYGKGGRKNASARAWIKPGTGKMFVNGIPYIEYFQEFDLRSLVGEAFYITGTVGQFDSWIQVSGGGMRGQAGAVKHAISVAMQSYDPEFRPTLKANKLLTRDGRVVERKHTGKKKARKSFTWVKR